MATVQQTMQRAVDLHRRGELVQAENLYRQVIRLDPQHADACNLLGISCHQRQMAPEAIRYIRQAVQLNQTAAPYHCNLGMAYRGAGDLQAAVASYRTALSLQPIYPEAEFNLGITLHALHDYAAAEACFRRALVGLPGNPDVLLNLGNALQEQDRFEEAIDCFRQILKDSPNHFEAQFNLANCYNEQQQYVFAADFYRRAVEINPQSAIARYHLANMLQMEERHEEAIASYAEALQLDPHSAAAHNNLGATYYSLRRLDEATASYRQAVELEPKYAEAHNNLGRSLFLQGELNDSMASLQLALDLKPDLPDVHANLGEFYCAVRKLDRACRSFEKVVELNPDDTEGWRRLANIYRMEQRVDEAKTAFRVCAGDQVDSPLSQLWLDNFCHSVFDDDKSIDAERNRLESLIARVSQQRPRPTFDDVMVYGSLPPSNLQFQNRNNRQLLEAFSGIFRGCLPTEEPAPSAGKPKIGFVVTAGHEGIFVRFMGDALERMSRETFDLVVICSPSGAGIIRRMRNNDRLNLMPVPFRHDLLIEEVRAARFDVLYHFEVGTDITNYFLPFFRLAPIQCASQGISQTTGLAEIDYFLSSDLQEPEDAADHYTETLIRIPGLLSCQSRARLPSSPKTRADFGVQAQQTFYACPQKLRKIQPDFDDLCRDVLTRDPDGLLLLVEDYSGRDAARLRQRFERTMPTVANRIRFVPRLSIEDYFSLTAAADVLLDPLHYGSGETMYDAMSFNKPVVTLPGRFARGRYALGIYGLLEIDDCIATSAEDYVERAVKLGTDADYRRSIEEKLAAATPALFDDVSMVAHYERIFLQLVDEARGNRQRGTAA